MCLHYCVLGFAAHSIISGVDCVSDDDFFLDDDCFMDDDRYHFMGYGTYFEECAD